MRKIDNIDTETGNDILIQLKKHGWKVTKQYSPLAFDKGIDFDSYTLIKGEEKLHFTWNNWFEWEIQGSEAEISFLIKKFNLRNT